ncbi:Exodeoxyribonuclease V beta chain [Raoultella terrigena]|uniref:Exodeoxyribonuclease V beta chain n=1 Tax=Raoultella terrigena TaxID=577 RepID=A0A4U9D6I0_RAOTE|nr:Exodeoxyribonuclease V beta chain [Raoultella terrigena]
MATARRRIYCPVLTLTPPGWGEVAEEPQLTPHQFPRGASPGTFLHGLFEDLDFTQPVPADWMVEKLRSGGFAEQWTPVLTQWLDDVLRTPLPGRRYRAEPAHCGG